MVDGKLMGLILVSMISATGIILCGRDFLQNRRMHTQEIEAMKLLQLRAEKERNANKTEDCGCEK